MEEKKSWRELCNMYTVINFNLDSPKRKISHFLMYMYEYTSPFIYYMIIYDLSLHDIANYLHFIVVLLLIISCHGNIHPHAPLTVVANGAYEIVVARRQTRHSNLS